MAPTRTEGGCHADTVIGISVASLAGALARFAIEGFISQRSTTAFPSGTFVVNITGAFLLGLVFTPDDRASRGLAVAPLDAHDRVPRGVHDFSTLSLETFRLIEDNAYVTAALNSVGSLAVVIEIVDTAENIDRVLPALDEMVGEGMVTTERVHVIAYRGSPSA